MNLGDGESQMVEFSPRLPKPGRILLADVPARLMLVPVVRPREHDPAFVPNDPVRRNQIIHRMRHPMRPQIGSDIEVENAETADRSAAAVRKQRVSNTVLFGKGRERFLRIIADSRDADTVLLQHRTGMFQLDQLGAAVLSPVRAAVKHQQQSVRSGEIAQVPYRIMLVGKRKLRNPLAWL